MTNVSISLVIQYKKFLIFGKNLEDQWTEFFEISGIQDIPYKPRKIEYLQPLIPSWVQNGVLTQDDIQTTPRYDMLVLQNTAKRAFEEQTMCELPDGFFVQQQIFMILDGKHNIIIFYELKSDICEKINNILKTNVENGKSGKITQLKKFPIKYLYKYKLNIICENVNENNQIIKYSIIYDTPTSPNYINVRTTKVLQRLETSLVLITSIDCGCCCCQ